MTAQREKTLELLALAANKIKEKRLAAGLTLRNAASLCGLSVGTYHDVERGNWGSGVGNVLLIASTLKVDLNTLFEPEHIGNIETTIVNGRVRRRIIEDFRNPNGIYDGTGRLINPSLKHHATKHSAGLKIKSQGPVA